MDSKKPEKQEINIQIKADEPTSQGMYANFANIAHTPEEFLLDFLFVVHNPAFGKLLSRIIMNPHHVKRFADALNENIKKYEEHFGRIKGSGDSSSSSGDRLQ